jgi:hypothetical protein
VLEMKVEERKGEERRKLRTGKRKEKKKRK